MTQAEMLKQALAEGEQSGFAESFDPQEFKKTLKRGMRPAHVGAMIRTIMQGIMEETGQKLTIRQVATGLGIKARSLSNILHERQGINADMAIRLSIAFGSTPDFWLKLHRDHTLWHAEKKVDRSAIQRFC